MMELVPTTLEHMRGLLDEPMNRDLRQAYANLTPESLAACDATTILWKGQVMLAGGTAPKWPGSALVWALFSKASAEYPTATLRGTKKYFERQHQKYRRLEVAVTAGFEIGNRRVKLLGFKEECALARSYLPTGEDCTLYSMVKE